MGGLAIKLSILGTEYDFDVTTETKDPGLYENNGYCDVYEKRIAVEGKYNENAPGSIKDFEVLRSRVKRHECIHAMFYESGMKDWSDDENLVNWISIQFPKLLEIFKQIDAI